MNVKLSYIETQDMHLCPSVSQCLSFAYYLNKISLPFPPFSSVLRLLMSWGETVGVGGLQDLVSSGGKGGGREEDAPCLAHVCLIRPQI